MHHAYVAQRYTEQHSVLSPLSIMPALAPQARELSAGVEVSQVQNCIRLPLSESSDCHYKAD